MKKRRKFTAEVKSKVALEAPVGRALDNVMIERLWRTVKCDDIYIRGYETMMELYRSLEAFFRKYNALRHQTLGMSPEQKYREGRAKQKAA